MIQAMRGRGIEEKAEKITEAKEQKQGMMGNENYKWVTHRELWEIELEMSVEDR